MAGILAQVRTLYSVGARRFVVVNMPDLGATPIVLQNESYRSAIGLESDSGRRMELSRRLSVLSQYHDEVMQSGIEELRRELEGAEILSIDAYSLTRSMLQRRLFGDGGGSFDYGFDIEAFSETLSYQGRQVTLQKPCYTGAYLGTLSDSAVCDSPDTAFFWDVIHPSTLTHCWKAYFVGDAMAQAGWIEPMPPPGDYRDWCSAQRGTAQPRD